MANFLNKKNISDKGYDGNENEQNALSKRIAKFPVFVVIALVIVAIITGSIFYYNYNNNSLRMFVNSSSQVFDCGSFDYHISASINNSVCMDYTGSMEFDYKKQTLSSSYHAVYPDYEYDAVVFAENSKAYRGNYYNGKWSVSDYTSNTLDFFDFYNDYRKGRFDAGAALRFTDMTKDFNADQFEKSVNNITKKLSKPDSMKNILHQKITSTSSGTTITFTPDVEKVLSIIAEEIAPAYTSANDYLSFKNQVENSLTTQQNTQAVISYTINNDGYLTDFTFDYTVNDTNYFITCTLSNFEKAHADIPEDFFITAGISA